MTETNPAPQTLPLPIQKGDFVHVPTHTCVTTMKTVPAMMGVSMPLCVEQITSADYVVHVHDAIMSEAGPIVFWDKGNAWAALTSDITVVDIEALAHGAAACVMPGMRQVDTDETICLLAQLIRETRQKLGIAEPSIVSGVTMPTF